MFGAADFSKMPPLFIAYLAVFVAYSVVSFIVVVRGKGSEEAKEGGTGLDLILKYSPPWWRTVSRWFFPSWLILGIGYGIVLALTQ